MYFGRGQECRPQQLATNFSQTQALSSLGTSVSVEILGETPVYRRKSGVTLQHWKDEFLMWNPADYGGIVRIVVPPQLVWLPDFGLENRSITRELL